MKEYKYKTTQTIYEDIYNNEELGKEILLSDYYSKFENGISNEAIRKAFSDLTKDNVISRIDRGIYIVLESRNNYSNNKLIDELKFNLNINAKIKLKKNPVYLLNENNLTKQIPFKKQIILWDYINEEGIETKIKKVLEKRDIKISGYINFKNPIDVTNLISEYINNSESKSNFNELFNLFNKEYGKDILILKNDESIDKKKYRSTSLLGRMYGNVSSNDYELLNKYASDYLIYYKRLDS